MAAECRGVGVARELGEARDGVDVVVLKVPTIAVYLDQQMLAVGFDAGVLVSGEHGEVALEFSSLSLGLERWHGV